MSISNPEVWAEVERGRLKAHAKHGANSIESIAAADPRWLSILVEEVGEVSHELTYDSTGSLRAELIDVLTVASAWVDALDRTSPRMRALPSLLAHNHGPAEGRGLDCPERVVGRFIRGACLNDDGSDR